MLSDEMHSSPHSMASESEVNYYRGFHCSAIGSNISQWPHNQNMLCTPLQLSCKLKQWDECNSLAKKTIKTKHARNEFIITDHGASSANTNADYAYACYMYDGDGFYIVLSYKGNSFVC